MKIHGLFVGLTTIDLQFLVDNYPQPNTKTKSKHYGIYTGGPSTNAAITFSYLGGKADLLTSVGKHSFAEMIHAEFEKYYVQHFDLTPQATNLPTFATIITSGQNGDRTVFSYKPPDDNIAHEIHREIKFNDYELILLDGFYMKTAIEIAKRAKESGVHVILDGGSWKEGMENLLPFVDIAVCSADFHPPEIAGRRNIFDFLLSKNVQHAVITRGDKPILYKTKQISMEIPVSLVNTVDTLGAGDVFHGAFCYSFAQKPDIPEALEKATLIAGKSCTVFGTREWMEH